MVDTPLKIIFLDIDGVLNSDHYIAEREASPTAELWTSADLDPTAIRALNAIIVRTGAKVVVSSSWRHHHTLDELTTILRERGFVGDLIDATPRMYGESRGTEIRTWIRVQGVADLSIVVLDDEPPTAELDPRWVRTDPSRGLTELEVERAAALLNTLRSSRG
jgi:hypothetical protein